ncbi:MAG: 4-alpha-glucanotransferase, partial [Desulforhopalus sp.]
MSGRVLQDLAQLYGITVKSSLECSGREEGGDGRLLALLQAAGVPVNNRQDGADLLVDRAKKQRQQMLDPVRVISDRDMPLCLTVRLATADDHRYRWTLTEEDGRQHSGSFSRSDMTAVPDSEHALLDLDITLPCGYHRFAIEGRQPSPDTAPNSMLLIVTPARCYLPPAMAGEDRVWGIGSHLHALRSRNSWGIGDFADLQQLLAWGAARGAATLQVAPLHCLNSPKFTNPYVPSCRTGLNVLFINIDSVADFAENEAIRHHVGDARFQARLASLNSGQQVDYQAVAEIKGAVFKKLWSHFRANHLNPETPRGREFRDFQQRGGESARYLAIFSAIQAERFAENFDGHDWRTWPVSLRTPRSQAVATFARDHEQQIDFHQYLQWQAELQLAAVGNRSMELGLKIGLLTEFPYTCDPSGFESWYYDGLLLPAAAMARIHANVAVVDPAEGQPLISPSRLKDHRYKPFIDGLRHTMRYAGAVILRSFANYFSAPFAVSGQTADPEALLTAPFADLLAILSLESQRNRCLIIADDIDRLPDEMQREVRRRNIFTTTDLFQAQDETGNWVEPENYQANSVASTSPPFLAAMTGIWRGRDISLKTAENYFMNDAEKEQALLQRVAGRARFLLGLDRIGLLPDGYSVDPVANTDIGHPLVKAGQVLLAKSPARILVVSLNDLLGMVTQAEPPIMQSQEFWLLRYGVELEHLAAGQEIDAIFQALYRERGNGMVHSPLMTPDRKNGQRLRLPTAFYRLQLNKDFTFRQAAEIIPYLKDLSISHCYTSPFLKARPGSPHGYDIIDHCSLNPEIGGREDFEGFLAALQANRIELLLDIVPNHMAIGADNQWWMDVLENGQSSEYAIFFDINWQPQQTDMIGRVLLPVLGDHYGRILDSGQLTLRFNKDDGTFAIGYYQHRFPVDPGTYWVILQHDLQRLRDRLGNRHHGYLELHNLISSSENLPGRQETADERIQIRRRDQEVSKRILARLCRDWPELHQFIEENVILFNGEVDRSQSFDLLHDLLEKQAYRLAFWRVAADEINYRRFFDINHLAGLRMEEAEVFRQTHRYILDLIAEGKVSGLRIDHPDGLYDPRGYFRRLAAAASGRSHEKISTMPGERCKGERMPLYIVAEKIL